MAEKKNGDDVEAKIDDIARGLKELLAVKDAESPTAAEKTEEKKPAAKKPAAKKPAASKSTATKSSSGAAKKPAASKTSTAAEKPAAKKPATEEPAAAKAEPKAEEVAEGVTVNQTTDGNSTQPIIQVIVQAPAPAPAEAPKTEEPVPVEEVKAEEPVPAPVEEVKAEEPAPAPIEEVKAEEPAPAESPKAEEPKAEAAATTTTTVTTTVTTTKKKSTMQKINDFINNKGKLPIFIVVNALFLISAILLMFNSFHFELNGKTYNYNIFQYMGNSALVKSSLLSQAGNWTNGAYTMLGILMFIAMLVPLALLVKNVVLLAIKKKKDVYNFDAIVYFAAMMFLIAMANIFGAFLSFGQVFSLIISAIIFVFTVFALLLSGSAKRVPIFSIANVVLAFIAILLLTSKVYGAVVDGEAYSWYAAAAAGEFKAGGFMFLMLFIAICALVLLVILQIKRFPGAVGHIVEIVAPLAAAVCAIIALVVAGANKSAAAEAAGCTLKMGGGFVFGAILAAIIAVADTLLTFLAPLKKYKVTVNDEANTSVTTTTTTTTTVSSTVGAPESTADNAATEEKAEAPAAEATAPAPAEEKKTEAPASEQHAKSGTLCPRCGTPNPENSKFCSKCGSKLY